MIFESQNQSHETYPQPDSAPGNPDAVYSLPDQLPLELSAAQLAHLATCSSCQQKLRRVQQVRSALQNCYQQPAAPAALRKRIVQQIQLRTQLGTSEVQIQAAVEETFSTEQGYRRRVYGSLRQQQSSPGPGSSPEPDSLPPV